MAKVRREVKGETKCLESWLAEESTSSSSYLMSKVLSYTVMHNFKIHSLDVPAVSRGSFCCNEVLVQRHPYILSVYYRLALLLQLVRRV